MLKNPSYLLCGANKKADAPRVIAEVISFKSSSRIKVLQEHLIPLSESIRPFPYNVKQNFSVSFFQILTQTEKIHSYENINSPDSIEDKAITKEPNKRCAALLYMEFDG